MTVEVKIPSPGESITQVQLAAWLVNEGDYVEKDQEIAEIDSDKATLAIPATESGKIRFLVPQGETLAVGAVICTIDTSIAAPRHKTIEPSAVITGETNIIQVAENTGEPADKEKGQPPFSPLAKKVLAEKGLQENEAFDLLKKTRISRKDVESLFVRPVELTASREIERTKMSALRMKLSQRLVAVKNQTAMLTTFNEVDMSAILDIKNRFTEKFKEKYGVSVGFMSFFTKAVTLALQEFPQVNAQIDGEDMLVPAYVDMGIAVSGPKGLVVPVIRNAESLTLAEIEIQVKEYAAKARNNKLSLEEMSGGTFTITNGGVFGSMMSTPILNPPQSAILGMHAIIERPVAMNGQVVIRPMMYLALSYDHRVIDGRESVSFLVRVKENLENPARMLVQGKDPASVLLGL